MAPTPLYLCYDDRMLQHHPVDWEPPEVYPTCCADCPDGYMVENPERIRCIYNRLCQLEDCLLQQQISRDTDIFLRLNCEQAARESILLVHSEEHYDRLEATSTLSLEELQQVNAADVDMYYNNHTFDAALLACGGLVTSVEAVTSPTCSSARALALVRPPGHHACQSHEEGFCFINSVAVAAKHALHNGLANRVCILDWDIHHGNGTQALTYDEENIFYISLHRYTGVKRRGSFYPCTGSAQDTGAVDGSANGTNANVAWTHGGMGNVEYAAAMAELLLPLMVDFQPDLVLISCGLDAAQGDLLGDCCLTPDFYHAMTRSVLYAVDAPIVVALEGGYTMHVIADCMEAVTLALLDKDYTETMAVQECRKTSVDEAILDTTFLSEDSDSQSGSSSSFERLRLARQALKEYWNCDAPSLKDRGSINRSAVRCINETLAALKDTERWKDLDVNKLDARRRRSTTATKQRQSHSPADLASQLEQLTLG